MKSLAQDITTINLSGVNCYVIKGGKGCVLIDTGYSNKRTYLEKRLKELGCLPENLKLIILTHGDSDHAGNAAYLSKKYGVKTAIHADDAGMVERGDMGWNRKAKSDKVEPVFRIMMFVMPLFTRTVKFDVFKPDFSVDEGFDLAAYGLEARVIHLPGHSKGSIGVLTAGGDLICGDFVYNLPGFGLVNNLEDHRASVEKVKKLGVKRFYPGHGKPISMERFQKRYR
jgi:hydroxyacylglutathione hydrolase